MTKTILPIHAVTGLRAIGWRKARRGETGDQPIWPVLGGAEDDDDGADDQGDDDKSDDDTDGDDDKDDDTDDDDKPLGPKGEKALKAEKEKRRSEAEKRRAAEKKASDLERELAKFRKPEPNSTSKSDDDDSGKDDGDKPDPDRIRADAQAEAEAKANEKIVRAEIKAAAAGKLADPKDALLYIDASKFELDENGEVDSEELADAIGDLLEKKPYLAAQGGKRFQGKDDSGAKPKRPSRPQSLDEAVKTRLGAKP